MAQYTLKIKTYDPVIVSAFARLRKSRKQSAYTHEALKFFLATEQGAQVMELMTSEAATGPTIPERTTERPKKSQSSISVSEEKQSIPFGDSEKDYCATVLEEILK